MLAIWIYIMPSFDTRLLILDSQLRPVPLSARVGFVTYVFKWEKTLES